MRVRLPFTHSILRDATKKLELPGEAVLPVWPLAPIALLGSHGPPTRTSLGSGDVSHRAVTAHTSTVRAVSFSTSP